MTTTSEPLKTPRIEVIDALRGFAIMAILLVHCMEHFIYPVYPDPATQPAWLNVLDNGVLSVIFTLFAGNTYAIFALLFGFTFYIQYTNQQKKGKDFGPRFFWRLILLTGFATINAALFPGGDILLLFSIVGLVLILVRKWSNRAIGILSIIMLLQPVEWYHSARGLMDPAYTLPELPWGPMYDELAVLTKEGKWLPFLWANATVGQLASLLWGVGAGRITQTAGLFMLGYLIGRKQLFVSSESSNRFWLTTLIVAAILFAPLYQLRLDVGSSTFAGQTVGVVLDMWQKFAFAAVLVSSFVLLYQREGFCRISAPFRTYGKMSLSNYLMQSLLGALIFFPMGLNLAPVCGYAGSLLVGIAILIVQVIASKWWLSRYRQGPLEAVWHKLTWLGK